LEYYGHLRCFPQMERGILLLEEYVSEKRKQLFQEAGKLWQKLEETSFWRELYKALEDLPHHEEVVSEELPSFPDGGEEAGDA